jgi:hypothetical protein
MSSNPSLDVRSALPGSPHATSTWIELERHTIAMLARGVALSAILQEVARCVELALPGHLVSIMRRSRSAEELVLEVGPSLPREYAAAVARVPIGGAGVALRAARVLVATDPGLGR